MNSIFQGRRNIYYGFGTFYFLALDFIWILCHVLTEIFSASDWHLNSARRALLFFFVFSTTAVNPLIPAILVTKRIAKRTRQRSTKLS